MPEAGRGPADQRVELNHALAELERIRAERDHLQARLAEVEEGRRSAEERLIACSTAQLQQATKLHECEERFRKIYEDSPVGILLLDPIGRIVSCNRAAERLLGYSSAELRSLTFVEITHPDDRVRAQRLFDEVREGTRDYYEIEKRYLRKDGQVIWVQQIATVVRDEQGNLQLAIGQVDITQRRQREEALTASWEEYRRLVELSPDPIVVHSGGKVVFANTATAGLLGASRSEALIGIPVLDIVHPDFRDVVRERIENVLGGNAIAPLLEERWLRLDGSVIDVEVAAGSLFYQGHPSVQVIARDVTERRRVQATLQILNEQLRKRNEQVEAEIRDRTKALRESEQRFRQIFEFAPIGMVLFDREGRILEGNPAIETVLSYTVDDLRRLGIAGVTYPPDLAADLSQFNDLLAGKLEAYRIEKRYIRKDGTLMWGLLIVTLIRDAEGLPQYSMAMVENITEGKQLEAALRAQVEKEKELNRLKADLVNAVSHELRTPLTSIMGYAEFLEDQVGGPLSTPQQEYVHQIQEGTWRLQRLVDDLLDFARLEAGTFRLALQDVDLKDKVDEVLASLQPQARDKQIALTSETPPGPCPVRMDPGRIGQVLINLVINAIKFTPEGGRVTVTLKREPEKVCVQVADSGIGIAPENLPRLFQKFYQVDSTSTRQAGGAGLGLSISKALVAAHEGEIGAESKLGVGSTFWFTLPIAGPREPEPPASDPSKPEPLDNSSG